MAVYTSVFIAFLFFSAEGTFDPFSGKQFLLGHDHCICNDKRLLAYGTNGCLHRRIRGNHLIAVGADGLDDFFIFTLYLKNIIPDVLSHILYGIGLGKELCLLLSEHGREIFDIIAGKEHKLAVI